jgi:hypothetical protein
MNSVMELYSIVQSEQQTILFAGNREIRYYDKFAGMITMYNPECSYGEYSWYLSGENNRDRIINNNFNI